MLREAGVDYQRRDFFRDRFTRDELAALLARAGLTPHQSLSKRARAYKDLGLGQREVSDEELLDLMVAEPTLLRRPLVVAGEGEAALGFDRARLDALVAHRRE